MSRIHIVFDGPPGPEAGRFIEVENDDRASVRVGEWVEREDGLWELVIPVFAETITRLTEELAEANRKYEKAYDCHGMMCGACISCCVEMLHDTSAKNVVLYSDLTAAREARNDLADQVHRLTAENTELKERLEKATADNDSLSDAMSYHENTELRIDLAACRKELDESQSLAERRGKGIEVLRNLCDEKDVEIKALKEAK